MYRCIVPSEQKEDTNFSYNFIIDRDHYPLRQQLNSIREIVEMVAEWMRYFDGVKCLNKDDQVVTVYYSYEAAAVKLGMKRKTLNDYKLLVRQACKSGFDFDGHAELSVNAMRRHIWHIKNLQSNSSH